MIQIVQQSERTNNILPTTLSSRTIIVLKPRYEQTVIKLLAKKLKNHVFPRKSLRKPKNLDIELTSLEKKYEYYLITKGKYSIDHCKSLVYDLEVEKDAEKVFLLNETLKPQPYSAKNSDEYFTIKLNGVASFHYEDVASCIIDNRGQEIDSKDLDYILNHDWCKEKLKKTRLRKEFSKPKITQEEEINLLKNKLIKRPKNIGEVLKEIFEITERKLIYVPMYQLIFRNKKNEKEAIIKINGITGKIILTTFSNKVLPIKLIEEANRESYKIIKPVLSKPFEKSQKTKSNKTISVFESKLQKNNPGTNSEKLKPKQIKSISSSSPEKLGKNISSEFPEIKVDIEHLEFPAKVSGDVFYVGDKLTAIVGDMEIPSETYVNNTLIVKGNLIIGKKCRILATVKALGNIIIGADTIIKGNVISSQKVSVGPRVEIQGEVIIKKSFSSQIANT